MIKKNVLIILLLYSGLSIGCKKHIQNQSKNYEVASLPKDDSKFLALKDTAQSKLKTFIDSLDIHGKDDHYSFLVKSDFVEDGKHEHMWSRIFERNNDAFSGTFIDSAYELKHIKTGTNITVYKNDIEDWSIFNKLTGKTIGEFSTAYLESKMNKSGSK